MSSYCIPLSGSNPHIYFSTYTGSGMLLRRSRYSSVLSPFLGGRDLKGTKNAPKNVELYYLAIVHGYS